MLAVLGLSILLVAIILFLVSSPLWWSEGLGKSAGATEQRIFDHLQKRRQLLRVFAFRSASVLAVIGIFLLFVPSFAFLLTPPNIIPGPIPGPIQTSPLAQSWPMFGVAGIALLAGAALILFGRNLFAQIAGVVTMVAGLTAHGYLIKDLKINDLIKVGKIDLNFEAEFNKYLNLRGFGPQHIAEIGGFPIGKSGLTGDMRAIIKRDVCPKWTERGREGLLLVIGATDRVPLGRDTKLQYESNFGLARARAESVKTEILECENPPTAVLALVSGPRNTPKIVSQRAGSGFAEDRRVDVWAFWNKPEPDQIKSEKLPAKVPQ